MKILITSPLFPPENHYPAHFSKNLAKNLSSHHEIEMLVFSDFPENIQYIKIFNIPKNTGFFKKASYLFFHSNKAIKKNEIIILNQAGTFSFLISVLSRIYNKKIITKIKEDEVEERINRFGLGENSFKLKLLNYFQKKVLKSSDLIIFDNQELADNFIKKYKIEEEKTKILKHPEHTEILPFDNSEIEVKNKQLEWENYLSEFIKILNKYESNK